MASIGIFRSTSAVPGVNLFLRAQEEDHERQVVVEFKEVQIQIIDTSQPNPYELVSNVFDALETDNLPVKFMASRSRHAPHHDHERFAARPRQGFALLKIENPAVRASRLIPTPGLSQQRGIGESNNPEGQEDDAQCHKQSPPAS